VAGWLHDEAGCGDERAWVRAGQPGEGIVLPDVDLDARHPHPSAQPAGNHDGAVGPTLHSPERHQER
jgi:hypothetical protein